MEDTEDPDNAEDPEGAGNSEDEDSENNGDDSRQNLHPLSGQKNKGGWRGWRTILANILPLSNEGYRGPQNKWTMPLPEPLNAPK